MSDLGYATALADYHRTLSDDLNSRKGLGDQVQEKVTPDSQKSTIDKASETASGAYDRAASAVQPGTCLPIHTSCYGS